MRRYAQNINILKYYLTQKNLIILLKILQNICIKPTTRDVHLSTIKAFVTYNLSHFGAKHIVTLCDLQVLLGLGVAY